MCDVSRLCTMLPAMAPKLLRAGLAAGGGGTALAGRRAQIADDHAVRVDQRIERSPRSLDAVAAPHKLGGEASKLIIADGIFVGHHRFLQAATTPDPIWPGHRIPV